MVTLAASLIAVPSWLSPIIIYGLILLFILLMSIKNRELYSPDGRLFCLLVAITLLNFIANGLGSIPWDGNKTSEMWLKIADFFDFALNGLLILIYSLYVYSRVKERNSLAKTFIFLHTAVYLADLGMSLGSVWNSFFFGYESGDYARGSFFFIHVILLAAMVILVEAVVFSLRKSLDKHSLIYYASFPLLPILGIVFQIVFTGLPWGLSFVTIAVLIDAYYRKSRSTEIDGLTGTWNRRKLDSALYARIKGAKNGRSFSLILVDLDHFKVINDTLGHTVGDEALEDAAVILKKSVVTKDDAVGRYGGDEFCLVTEITDPDELMKMAKKIQERGDAFNATSSRPYKLGFSVGYSTYDPSSKMPLHEFYDVVDKKMYADKVSRSATR